MRIQLLVFLLSIYQTHSHGQHASNSQASTGGQPHISRKMEDYVHDIKYKNSLNLTNPSIILHSFSHIKHDLQGQINKPTEQMTPEEQNFYYFKIHDTNNDNHLDGLEVIAAFDHTHEEENTHHTTIGGSNSTQTERLGDEELTNLIDDILKEEDLDHDGFISYEEFKRALEHDIKSQR